MMILKASLLFIATAVAEIVGCYLPYLWLRKGYSPGLLVPAALALVLFAWLLTLHPTAAGRVYAAYGGVYVATAVFWLWAIDGERPNRWDILGAGVTFLGMVIIMLGASEAKADATAETPADSPSHAAMSDDPKEAASH